MATRLNQLVGQIRKCRICVDQPKRAPLPHAPRPVLRVSSTARLGICGQAPGTRVHQSGVPFDDPSGERLRKWMGVTNEEFYDDKRVAIIPMGFCFPGLDLKGGDLPPRTECAAHWHGQLFDRLPQLELLLLVGMYAQRYHLKASARSNLTGTVQRFSDYLQPAPQNGRPWRCIPLPHPSWRNNHWLKNNPWFETELLPVLRTEVTHCLN